MRPMTSVVIVAAGKGKRMGPNVDKLFLSVARRPLIAHTWQRFDDAPAIDEVILVIREGMESVFEEIASSSRLAKPYRFCLGGAERQDSVWNGLMHLNPATEIVAIHDGARPCVTNELIAATVETARRIGAAVAAQRVTDTIKESSDGEFIQHNLNRDHLWSVQTPQTFRVEIIRRALSEVRARGISVTDDTAACELIGQPVGLVESRSPNPKATSPADLPYLELLLK
jgi:2-C-methyl-D-erythritol 4-phosphate cytidylyltransferase